MIKLGVNSVLFKAFSFREAAEAIARCGYDGVEISAIEGMCEHLNLKNWKNQKSELKSISEYYNLPFLSSEVASRDRDRLLTAFEAAAEIGIPVLNIGSGGTADDEDSFKEAMEIIATSAADAEGFGVYLCVKAHVGSAVHDTKTTLRMVETVNSKALGVDMDPSHIHRAGENPAEELPKVIHAIKHIHIRDCLGPGPSPGEPKDQACGRGDIDLYGYFDAMVKAGYDGPLSLEIIGPEQDSQSAYTIAAESYGYMNALLRFMKAR
ncbi:MAG TPA: sugar phosphate isomerase/epimerase [Clostridiales bacterium]|jgi:sugar phosphate isomerase/epimerase|nr:sugar phosphate isomerase/epimerase [Clostridiales bacterium]HRT81842.1 sugar phosphate isomerase/epimerase [Oscillospiraceae bacterium]